MRQPHTRTGRGKPAVRAAAAAAAVAVALPLLSLGGPAAAGDDPRALQQAFRAAAERHQVPEEVLLGVSYLQSRWDGHRGAASVTGGYGPMHLTDAQTALTEAGADNHHLHGEEDPRGDAGRPLVLDDHPEPSGVPDLSALPERFRTLDRAAELTGLGPEELRTSNAANVQGGAALLAAAQRELEQPLSEDPADWYGAVAAYAGSATQDAAETFADEVYEVIGTGERHTTGEGQTVELAATEVEPRTGTADGLGLPRPERDPRTECPRTVSCEWVSAAYEQFERPDGSTGYGNHDKADRPRSQKIEYLVIHDMEGYFRPSIGLVQDPTWASWQYSLQASDGHIAQHIPARDVAWQAGNWYVNATSIGLEHEGFLRAPDAWYTEAMYRTSARLVQYLAGKHGIPLDRHHILGHDSVPGIGPANIPGMHTDPGPYWDWAHYFRLMGAPVVPSAGPDAELITVRPDYDRHRPQYTGCTPEDAALPCAPHGSSAVRLHVAPDHSADLVPDIGTHPGRDGRSGISIYDIGARASTGQQFAVADRDGDWTAIWFNGEKAWFHHPPEQPTAVASRGWVATPRDGLGRVPVYGVAYPEPADYPEGVPVRAFQELPYAFTPGQSYAVGRGGQPFAGEFYSAVSFDPENHQVVRGQEYYQIQLGHRHAYVKAEDVEVTRAGRN
ncbi:N-acetylmuramoyl-L-alanine amidase [Streptomyces sp. ACA25]|uniref:N-acetylmuramoyl-L-alanine amidase n=1 Tax=Streptomyces sp. ACA25 TaxID=3022596 RepID=UPI0023079262|nr:N-acetylmuramoyl-L-alanine amidase [Streptomyces sp. ACA25]MDB1086062.1 N-acetylmuramoyl-L-alanine amidase [Streptomyces sp. ACA25]